jgi:hypothetical protein
MPCPHCSAQVPENARFCPQCGVYLEKRPAAREAAGSPAAGLGVFLATTALSVLISIVLTVVFNRPIFFLGAVLPLFWLGRRHR